MKKQVQGAGRIASLALLLVALGTPLEIHVVVRDSNVTLRAPLEHRPTWIAKVRENIPT